MKTMWLVFGILLFGSRTGAATIEDVTFLSRIQVYETVADTTLVTQEGKRIPLHKGTKVNVAGFTETEALIVSRSDRPNGFIRKADLTPAAAANRIEPSRIKEETLPQVEKEPKDGAR